MAANSHNLPEGLGSQTGVGARRRTWKGAKQRQHEETLHTLLEGSGRTNCKESLNILQSTQFFDRCVTLSFLWFLLEMQNPFFPIFGLFKGGPFLI